MHWLVYFTLILMKSGDIEVNPGPSSVTEGEFLRLAQLIPPRYYKDVGIHLGIPDAELDHIIVQHSSDYKDALMSVFTRWRDEHCPDEDIRALLAEGLEKSDLGGLSKEVLAGNLIQKRPGSPIKMPTSQTQPLTPNLVERNKKELQSHYRRYFCKIRADSLNPRSLAPCEDIYTNLLLKEEDYPNKKRPLEYKGLFKLEINGEFQNRIIIQGEAGAGKTTLCAKIAWDWINDSPDLPKFVWVLVIPLREARRYTIGQIVKSYLSKDNPSTACQITEYIRSNQEKVFIACDGLDEFSGKVIQHSETKQELEGAQPDHNDQPDARPKSNRSELMGHMPSGTSFAPLLPRGSVLGGREGTTEGDDISLVDIIRSDELSDCPVVVTSRPWKANEIKWDHNLLNLYAVIYVEGFSQKNVEVYIHKYFKDNKVTADQLIQMIKENNIISEKMAPYPIYVSMLCLMWRGLDEKKKEVFKTIQTFSEIFHELFEFLKVHYVQKKVTDLRSPSFNANRSEIEKRMEPIAKLAFTGLQSNNLIFNEDDLAQFSSSVKTACDVGVLSQEDKLSSIHDKSSSYLQSTIFFPHKLFQEYMGAVYLDSIYHSDHNEFKWLFEGVVQRKKEFRYLLYFTVSHGKTIAEYVTKRLLQQYTQSQGYDAKKTEVDFLVDVAFESRDEESIAMLSHSVSPLIIDVGDAHTIAGYASTGIGIDKSQDFGASYGPGISNDVASIVCSAPSLRDVELRAIFHPTFYKTLAKEGRKATALGKKGKKDTSLIDEKHKDI
nr:uncharacterized protein LOC129267111 [Lytechinus pictus]